MVYADTDFFLALLKPSDWLKESARKIYERYRGEITTSEATFLELLILSKKFDLDPVRLLAAVMAIIGEENEDYLRAAYYMKEHGLNPFDAVHAAKCGGTIISSDKAFDKLGIKRIKLESREE
ncbi:type II toxin-antitoxin system VapC family toxin [Thermococcus sp. GR7]|uniref:type II toxin-antitoxin system VapC family toxin n=1 Tax=unclassified Thermococcus TaxID=2627626 RepID=UPI00143202DF|nr:MULTISPECIES: PIN domain-containing protein [unclassified Thermococcus]NJE47031.1 type II toxin-antitoxin system VapC family toxin [Thermococcus sp. GR7]NJE78144.1 type II toxin-antitoxin system VapC family toxin [Thermococcus sp. GR4]NJF22739.1 type II toxin-antitoxin system VapC family toxin [Thermococcus sp. GR5]